MIRAGMDSRKVPSAAVLRHWVQGHLGSVRHERRVSRIAGALVQSTLPLHTLLRSDLRLLKMAAIAHDVGRCISDKDHPAVGARMILQANALPLKKQHRRAISYMTLYHRGPVPQSGKDSILGPSDDIRLLRLLLAFLRAADALDSRSLPSPRIAIRLSGRCLKITCRLTEDSPKARKIFTRRKKFRLLEEMLDCRVEVTIKAGQRTGALN